MTDAGLDPDGGETNQATDGGQSPNHYNGWPQSIALPALGSRRHARRNTPKADGEGSRRRCGAVPLRRVLPGGRWGWQGAQLG